MLKLAIIDDISVDSELSYIRGVISGLREAGFRGEITLYVRKDRKVESVQGAEIKKAWGQSIFPLQLTRYMIKDHEDLVHVQFDTPTFGVTYTPLLLPFLFLLLRIAGRRASVTIHSVPPISDQDQVRTMSRLLKMRSLPVPRIFLRLATMITYSFIGTFAGTIIVHTPVLKRWLEQDYRIPGKKIVVIRHGSALQFQNVTEESSPPVDLHGRKIVLFFGRVNPRKGLETLLKAWSGISYKYREYVLVIAGTIYRYDRLGQYFTSLKNMASDLGINDSVIFTGRLSEEQIGWYFSNCEFVVLPYQFSSAASGPLALAIGFGKPVIASAIGTFNDEISNNVNGILVKTGDENGLEEAIESLIGDKDLRTRLEKNAKRMITGRTWENHAEALMQIWSKET